MAMTFKHTGTILRATMVNDRSTYTSIGTTQAFLQPLDNQSTALLNMEFGQAYYVYLPVGTNIKKSDRIAIDGEIYGVRGVKKYTFGGLAHYRALVEEQ